MDNIDKIMVTFAIICLMLLVGVFAYAQRQFSLPQKQSIEWVKLHYGEPLEEIDEGRNVRLIYPQRKSYVVLYDGSIKESLP